MQTPTVQTQSNILSSPMSGAKQQHNADVPFNQMLSQQIAGRSNPNKASKASEPNTANKTNDTNKAGDSNKGNANTDAVSKQAPSGDVDAPDSTLIGKDKKADDVQINNAAVPVSAELMALVANHLNQANTKSADELSASVDSHAALATGRSIAGAKDSLSEQTQVKASIDKASITGGAGRESSLKPGTGFAATMATIEQTAESKQSLQVATAKLQETLPAIATDTMPQLQQTAMHIAQTIAAHPTDKLTPQVGSPAWDQALGQKVVWMVAGEQQSASLTLNPPDLGPMQVVLNVTNGFADATFTANQPEVRQALEAALPKLREMMNDAGIQLGQAKISAGMPNQQNQSGEQTGQNSRGRSQGGDSVETTARITGTAKITGGQGLVDTFA